MHIMGVYDTTKGVYQMSPGVNWPSDNSVRFLIDIGYVHMM